MTRLLFLFFLLTSHLLIGQEIPLPESLNIAEKIWEQYPDSAFSLTEKVIKSNPEPYVKGRAYFRQGRILLNERQAYHKAETAFLKAAAFVTDNYQGRAYRNLGRVCDRLGAAGLTGVGTRRAVQHADPRTAGGCIEQPLRSAVKPRCQRRPRPKQQSNNVSALCQPLVKRPRSNRSCSGHVRVNPASQTPHGSHRSSENTRLGHPNRHPQPTFSAPIARGGPPHRRVRA